MRQLAVLALAVCALSLAAPNLATAAANRTFVSGQTGSDSNDCSFNNPCRTFATALAATNALGEIVALDAAEYGTVTINKSISILNDSAGVVSISSATNGNDAIAITAGATDVVNLRGLTLDGSGGGDGGISVSAVGTLNIQDCVIRGFSNTGISYAPTGSSTLTVLDTIVSHNAGTGSAVLLSPNGTGLTVTAYLGRVQVIGNAGHGIDATGANMGTGASGTMLVTVADSVSTGNGQSGVLLPIFSNNVTMIVTDTALTNNATGATAVAGKIYLAGTTISGNTTGFSQTSGGSIFTFKNPASNLFTNRITDTTNVGSLTSIAQQ